MSIQSDFEKDFIENGPSGPGYKECGEHDTTHGHNKETNKDKDKSKNNG